MSGTLTSPPTDDSDLVARVIPLSRRGDRPPPPEFDLYADASLASRLDVPRHSERQAAIADTRTLEQPAVERSRRPGSLPAGWRALSLIVAVAAVVVVGLVVLVGGTPRPHSRPLAHPPHTTATVSSTLTDQHAAQRKAAATRAKKAAALRAARARAKARRNAAQRAHVRTPVRSAPVRPPVTTPASSSTTTNPCATAVPGQLGC